jgi:hypothetical protein
MLVKFLRMDQEMAREIVANQLKVKLPKDSVI